MEHKLQLFFFMLLKISSFLNFLEIDKRFHSILGSNFNHTNKSTILESNFHHCFHAMVDNKVLASWEVGAAWSPSLSEPGRSHCVVDQADMRTCFKGNQDVEESRLVQEPKIMKGRCRI